MRACYNDEGQTWSEKKKRPHDLRCLAVLYSHIAQYGHL